MQYDRRFAVIIGILLLTLFFGMAQRARFRSADILILSPHPDDAVLCCAGQILQAIRSGQTVRVVNITDGDGFATGAARLARTSETGLAPADYLRYGATRREEDVRALNILGLKRQYVTFLGYPDYWLPETYHATDAPFTNPFTKRSQTPAGRSYTKQSLVSDIRDIIARSKPTIIFVPGLDDTAPDHQVVFRALLEATETTASPIFIRRFIIHADDGLPHSIRVTLTLSEQETKRNALRAYLTQLAEDADYLMSFADTDEHYY